MASSFILTIVAAAIGFFMLLIKLRFHQVNKDKNSSSPLPSPPSSLSVSSSPPSSSSSLSVSSPSSPQSSLSRTWDHNVFPSFHGPDVRKGLLSHLREKFRSKGIGLFIDNEIKRGESIGPELKRAIKGSQIAIVFLSKNYASSSWCLDELVEIMECRDLGQTVMTIFYDVEPTDVKKQIGYFGEVFKKTCQGKTEETSETWRKALKGVATIAGYDLKNWDDEATMIETIATEISNKLNMSTLSCGFDHYIGMGAHIEKMKPLLRMDSDEVRMIGIWGPPGIGKSTIARVLFHNLSNSFQSSAIMNIKEIYSRLCRDEYNAQVQLQTQMLSQMLNQKDLVIPHLRVAEERLKYKKVLLVLDDVDQLAQLDALAKKIEWFGPGSRILIITEDVRVLRAHRINHIYTVGLPSDDEALQMFCMYAFDQKYPTDGLGELAWQVVCYAGKLPLGLEVMGSYFRNMSMQDWKKALPKVWSSLDGKIESVLKFSYDALDYEEKALFLHIACFFENGETTSVQENLSKRFPYVHEGLDVLANKSLIYLEDGEVKMHDLLVQLGKEIVRRQSPDEPGQRQFLVDSEDISEILAGDATGSKKVIGINFYSYESELNISERAFEGMYNLQFLKIKGNALPLPHGLSYLSPKLRLLDWEDSPFTCFPSNVNLKFLVELRMLDSKLEKLWEGIKPLPNLKWMDLSFSENLKELPNLSTAINLQRLLLNGCTSLVEVPASIGSLHKLERLDLSECSKLEVLPVNVNLRSLDELNLSDCSSLKSFPEISTNIRDLGLIGTAIEEVPSSIRSWSRLERLNMSKCKNLKKFMHDLDSITERDTKIEECKRLPVNINLKSLDELRLSDCSLLKSFPEISTNIRYLDLKRTAIEEVPSSIRSWSRLEELDLSNCKNLKKFMHDLDSITEHDTNIQEVSPLVQEGFPRLIKLILYNCKNLVSLPQLPDSLSYLDARNCESLERLDWSSLSYPGKELNFANCFKLNKEARDLIIETSNGRKASLPGKEIPTYFTHRGGGFLTVKLKKWPFPSSLKFRVCILLVSNDSDDEDRKVHIQCRIMDGQNHLVAQRFIPAFGYKPENLYIFPLELDVPSNKFCFKFFIPEYERWVEIKDWGVHCEVNEDVSYWVDEEEEEKGPDAADTSSVMVDTISKYTSNSEAGCSKSILVGIGLDDEECGVMHNVNTKKRMRHYGDYYEAEEETNEGDNAETKKGKMVVRQFSSLLNCIPIFNNFYRTKWRQIHQ